MWLFPCKFIFSYYYSRAKEHSLIMQTENAKHNILGKTERIAWMFRLLLTFKVTQNIKEIE